MRAATTTPFSGTFRSGTATHCGLLLAFAGIAILGPAGRSPTRAEPAAASSTSIATIDVGHREQRLAGFGGATAYYQDWIAGHPYKTEIYNALFRDLKLDILRLQNVWRPTKGADFAKNDQDIVKGAGKSLGHPITILMSSWSPPGNLKSTGSEKNGGTLASVNGAFVYDRFGQYWADALAAYRRLGIVPTYVSIQNEPDWKAEWETCLFKPTEQVEEVGGQVFDKGVTYAGYDKALDATYRKLQALPPARRPQLIGPEPTGIGDKKVLQYLDTTTPRGRAELAQLNGLAYHLYNGGDIKNPDSFLPMLHAIRDAYPGKPNIMTEYDYGDTQQTAWLMHNCLTEADAAAYVYWSAIWPNDAALIRIEDPKKPSEWKTPHGWKINPKYWAIKHFAYFTAPGWYRVDTHTTNDNVKLSAFVRPDNRRLTAVLINTSPTDAATIHLDLTRFKTGFRGPGMSTTVFQTTDAESWKSLGALPAGNTLVLPPRSTVTIAWR